MPCIDAYSDYDFEEKPKNKKKTDIEKRLDNVTAMLCAVCKIFDNDLSLFDRGIDTSEEAAEAFFKIKGLKKWWKEHSEFDKKRLETVKKSAMSKLTKEEKEALGLGN